MRDVEGAVPYEIRTTDGRPYGTHRAADFLSQIRSKSTIAVFLLAKMQARRRCTGESKAKAMPDIVEPLSREHRGTATRYPYNFSLRAVNQCPHLLRKIGKVARNPPQICQKNESTLKAGKGYALPAFRVLSARYHLNSAVSRGTHSPDASGTSGSWAGALFPETRRRLPRVLGTGLHQPPALCALGTRVLLRVLVFL